MKTNTMRSQFIFLLVVLSFCTVPISKAGNIQTEVKSYIKNIKSIAVEFDQQDSTGKSAKGMLIISKPYKFRCNYYDPFPILIVGNKNYVSIYDYEMETMTRIKAEENIFNFLLVDQVDFDNKFEILSAQEQDNYYVLSLRSVELDKISEIWFDTKTKYIKKMQIFEENNTITLNFSDSFEINNISKELFILKDPDNFGKPERLNKVQLEKKYNILR